MAASSSSEEPGIGGASGEGGFPPVWRAELEGWDLFWLRAAVVGQEAAQWARRRLEEESAEARRRWQGRELAADETVAAVRALFRAAGCDPTRYRPSSEALLRRVLKGDALPSIHPLVDLNNILSLRLAVPACVLAAGSVEPPLTLRAGKPEEIMDSLRGPFKLAGKPLLEDRQGPFGTPITDSERVKVQPATRQAWLVAYLPTDQHLRPVVEALVRQLAEASVGVSLLAPPR